VSVSARCIVIGVLVFLYWVAAFAATALTYVYRDLPDAWWSPAWLTTPGHALGRPCVDLLRSLGAYGLCQHQAPECWVTMLAGAASMGTGAWLLSARLAGWWQRRKNAPLPPQTNG
jgi:hypothetical protein